jgi:hypothetical protein
MGTTVREFMTHWNDKGPIWFERDEDELVGTQRSGGRPMPRIRMADLFRGYTNSPGNQPIVVWAGQDGVIEAQYIHGPEENFHRGSDYDILIFQYTGHAGVETEMGEYQLAPAHCMHIPAGVAYRVIGGNECRQMVVKLHKPIHLGVDPTSPFTETEFDVRIAGSGNGQAVAFPDRRGKILEITDFFGDEVDPIVIERDHARLVGAATAQRSRDISVIRVFDYFTGMTGKGKARAPMHYDGEDFRTDAYNTEGQQFGFHRGADDDEIWFQFRGHALNETEWGNHELDPLEMGYVPRGIAHRINGGEGFLRFVLYFHHPMFPKVDESGQTGRSQVAVHTASTKELPALAEEIARLESAGAGARPGGA